VYGYWQDEGYYNASLTNFPVRSILNNGAYSTRLNADFVKNIIRKKIYENPRLGRKRGIYTMLLTEPNCIYGTDERNPGRRKIGWTQAIYPLRARLQELKSIRLLPEKWDDTLEDELTELKKGEQAFMSTRPKLIQAGYTTLDSIPRIQKGSGTRFYCPALKGLDSKPQEIVSRWIQLLRKHPAHLHAIDIKDARKQKDPGIKPLEGMKLADNYIVKRNKIRNQCTLLRG